MQAESIFQLLQNFAFTGFGDHHFQGLQIYLFQGLKPDKKGSFFGLFFTLVD